MKELKEILNWDEFDYSRCQNERKKSMIQRTLEFDEETRHHEIRLRISFFFFLLLRFSMAEENKKKKKSTELALAADYSDTYVEGAQNSKPIGQVN